MFSVHTNYVLVCNNERRFWYGLDRTWLVERSVAFFSSERTMVLTYQSNEIIRQLLVHDVFSNDGPLVEHDRWYRQNLQTEYAYTKIVVFIVKKLTQMRNWSQSFPRDFRSVSFFLVNLFFWLLEISVTALNRCLLPSTLTVPRRSLSRCTSAYDFQQHKHRENESEKQKLADVGWSHFSIWLRDENDYLILDDSDTFIFPQIVLVVRST